MLIFHKGHTDTIQVYSVTVMTHVKALQAGHSSQGTSEPITPGRWRTLHRERGGGGGGKGVQSSNSSKKIDQNIFSYKK